MSYAAPLAEQQFVLETVADLPGLSALAGFEAATPDVVGAVLEEAAKLSASVFAPLNRIGDQQGARLDGDVVSLPAGFADAYARYVEGGWAGLGADPAHGGQGLPFVLATAVQEQLTSANMAFSLCMMLSQGAIEALQAHASPEQQSLYLSRLVSGEWTGTMNLTEPQAGSDVGALKTRAEPHADGSWRIKGQKIYITWGEHDVAPNIVHLVLARTPEAPAGTRGISLFIVPKFLVNADGSPGARNDVRCVGIEHKLGIHASPTCTMSFGDNDACVGYLVGEVNAGMKAMFTMMNHARISVGLQGVAIAERATQAAYAYARDRQQMGPIINHADVRRMLLTMSATTQAIRALTYFNAAAVDRAHRGADEAMRRAGRGLADLMTPITKAYATDAGVEVASLGVQVHGGMGYVEETGAAQHYRDIRIAPIYEGTNGIQAMDLVGRKLGLDNGVHWRALIAEMELFSAGRPDWPQLADAIVVLRETTEWMASAAPADRGAGAAPYLRLFGTVVGAWLLAMQAEIAAERRATGGGDPAFLDAKVAAARFFNAQLLPPALGLAAAATAGFEPLAAVA